MNAALQRVSRELVGAIPAVSINTSVNRAAKNQTVTIPINATETASDITEGVTAPDTGDTTVGTVTTAISNFRKVPIRFTGEDEMALSNGAIWEEVFGKRFEQAIRTLTNEIESSLLTEMYQNSSRAYGTAGTTPFASNLTDIAQVRKMLDDNGAPGGQNPGERSLVIDTTAGANMRTLANLSTDNAAGTDETLRQGTLLPLFGMDVKESAQIVTHTKGTGTGYDIVAAGEAVGQTTLSLEGGSSGTILPGDVVTFAGGATDTNKYVVTSGGTASGAAAGTIDIGNPGLKIVKVDADEMTIGNTYTANVGFSRSSTILISRFPALPSRGDGANDVFELRDPLSGLTFQVVQYGQYRQAYYEVAIAYEPKVVQSEHVVTLLG
jgi:hypothetical protein